MRFAFLPILVAGGWFASVSAGPAAAPSGKPDRVDPRLTVPSVAGALIQPFACPPDGGRAAVVLFLSVDCPIANRYAPEIERIRTDYAGQGVAMTLIQVDPGIADDDAAEHARAYGLQAPVVVDRNHTLVRAAGATVTPEAVVIDPEGRIRYRGRIDDQFPAYGSRRTAPESRDLRNALDALVAGLPVPVTETEALGCYIQLQAPD